ncbi:hypothetical protein [Kitasatospora sp. NPDC001527]|uniref:hypothetical protein n=1 Tax=Kitasatospora sp. NPDC001527 TaxID=3154519 RepID=UPI0033251FF2
MNAPTRDVKPPAWRRLGGAVARALPAGLFPLAGLAITVLCFSRFVDVNDTTLGYRSAPVCATAAHTPGTDCVRRETGKVTEQYTVDGDGRTYMVGVAREAGRAHRYSVNASFYAATKVGTDVDLTIYRGRVAELVYQGHHTGNPGTLYLASFKVALLAGLGVTLTILGLTWPRVGARAGSFAFAMGCLTVATAMLGCLTLITMEWSLAALLAIPVFGWLATTGGAAVIVRDESAPGMARR